MGGEGWRRKWLAIERSPISRNGAGDGGHPDFYRGEKQKQIPLRGMTERKARAAAGPSTGGGVPGGVEFFLFTETKLGEKTPSGKAFDVRLRL